MLLTVLSKISPGSRAKKISKNVNFFLSFALLPYFNSNLDLYFFTYFEHKNSSSGALVSSLTFPQNNQHIFTWQLGPFLLVLVFGFELSFK